MANSDKPICAFCKKPISNAINNVHAVVKGFLDSEHKFVTHTNYNLVDDTNVVIEPFELLHADCYSKLWTR